MSDLLPCPLCGASKGYELAKGDTSRWWLAVCAGCGDFVCECRSDSAAGYNAELPTHWGPADLEWNRAAKHAHELRLGLDSANADIESLQRHCDNFLNEIERLRAENDALKSQKTAWEPIETAPKDGSSILLATPTGKIADGMWSLQYGVWAWPYVMVNPVYWKPLLTVPKPGEEND